MIQKLYQNFITTLVLLLFCVLLLPTDKINAVSTPNPGSAYLYSYDASTNSVTQNASPTVGSGWPTKSFSNPESLSGKGMSPWVAGWYLNPSNTQNRLVTNLPIVEDKGYLAFRMTDNQDIALVVGVDDQKTVGLFSREEVNTGPIKYVYYDFIYAYSNTVGIDPTEVYRVSRAGTAGDVTVKKIPASPELAKYVGVMNGIYTDNGVVQATGRGTVTQRYGVSSLVSDLVYPRTSKISREVWLCGKAGVEFNPNSDKITKLPADMKKELPADSKTWPGALFSMGAFTADVGVKLSLQYKFSDGVYVNASFDDEDGLVPIKNADGSWRVNMKDLPAGTYKITGIFFVRWANDAKTESRLDTPYAGWYKDWAANRAHREDDVDYYQIAPYEVTVNADGTVSDPTATEPNCSKLLTFSYRATENAGALTPSKEGSQCESGSSTTWAMIEEAFCSLTISLKNWADGIFLWAEGWMEKSIGIARNETQTANDNIESELPTVKTPGGNSTSTPSGTTASTSTNNTTQNSSTSEAIYPNGTMPGSSVANAVDAATEICRGYLSSIAANGSQNNLVNEPCLIKNLVYHSSATNQNIDTKAGVQIVNGGYDTFIRNNNVPNKCGVNNLVILKTDCTGGRKNF